MKTLSSLVVSRMRSSLLLAAALFGLAAMPWSANAAGAESDSLRVGISYVEPPFVAGSKDRTPEAIDTALAQELAKKLGLSAQLVKAQTVDADKARVVLAAQKSDAKDDTGSVVAIPTGYLLAPMAIMRTDTDIKSWEQLKDRTVCVAEGGSYVGSLAQRYGAKEMVYPAPTDALLALRTGQCDAAVHDEFLLQALLKLPEWKKFSAKLTYKGEKQPLVFLAAADDTVALDAIRQLTKEWKAKDRLAELTKSRANNMAFEVYLDQEVPDCH